MSRPSDDPDDDDAAARPAPPLRAAPVGAQVPRRPLYRVVEFVRDDRGRLREEGRVWHDDLRRVRQFGRALADNTGGSRVVIADNSGRVVEELPLPAIEHGAQGQWAGWRERPLPALPAARPEVRLKREAKTTAASSWVLPAPGASRPLSPGAPEGPQRDIAHDGDEGDVEVLLP